MKKILAWALAAGLCLTALAGCQTDRREQESSSQPQAGVSDTEPEDLDTRQEDHVADECRYFCMARPIRPVRQGEELALGDDPLNMRKR